MKSVSSSLAEVNVYLSSTQASLSPQALLGAFSSGMLVSAFVSHTQWLFHRVFPDYFATSAVLQSLEPPVCRHQTMKVPVRSSLPLRRRASAQQHLKCSVLPPSQPYHQLCSCPRPQLCLLPLSHHGHLPL